MKHFFLLLLCLSLCFNSALVWSQSCNCTIDEVIANFVTPCELIIGTVDTVSTTAELWDAINNANTTGGNRTILIADGIYPVASTLAYPYITANNVVFRSLSGNRDAVILTGQGMVDVAPNTEIGISAFGDNISIADLTIRDLGNHGISVEGDNLFVHNVKIQNTYEQMLKGTSGGDGPDGATVQCCLFEYLATTGPQFYIGGLDIHKGNNWLVRDNVFRNIASPAGSVAEHAIHFWDFSQNNTVERNWIVNCDRGIGFGLGTSPNEGGVIRNNMIYNDGIRPFHDVGIGIETSPNTKIYNNTIFIKYPNAIEYRFPTTVGVEIDNNLTNQQIRSRDGGIASLSTNYTDAKATWFVDTALGDLHLATGSPLLLDQGTNLAFEVEDDIDQTVRPQGLGFDIGAHEFRLMTNTIDINKPQQGTIVYPNPSSNSFLIRSDFHGEFSIEIYDIVFQHLTTLKGMDLTKGITVDASEWKAGLYFCSIKIKNLDSGTVRVAVVN